MAHFARIQDGIVIDKHVVDNNVITDEAGVEQETLGQNYLSDLWGGEPSSYIQYSYNANFRGCNPGFGYLWKPKPRTKEGGVFEAPPEPAP
jgi:hypothetical protein